MTREDPQDEDDDELRTTARRPLPTAALARVYQQQGLLDRARRTWREVLAAAPDHEEARAALEELGTEMSVPSSEAPVADGTISSGELPVGYGADEVVAMPVTATTLLVYWELSDRGLQRARQAEATGEPALCVVSSWLDPDGVPRRTERVEPIAPGPGERFLEGLPAAAHHVAAVGLHGARRFVAVAHAEPVQTPSLPPNPGR